MIPIIGQSKMGNGLNEFQIGDFVRTTPQYEKHFKESRQGKVCRINSSDVVTILCGGGKETMSVDWLIREKP